MRPFHGDLACLTGLRLRLLLRLLRHRNLYDTANALEQETGVSFLAADLRVLMRRRRWGDAELYVLGFVDVRDCSRLAMVILFGLRAFSIMEKLAAGKASAIADSFPLVVAGTLHYPELESLRGTLLSVRSDQAKASTLVDTSIVSMAMDTVMKWVAECPELKVRRRKLPRCPFNINRTYIVSLGPGFWERKRSQNQKNKAGRRIPPRVLARCFMRKRMSSVAALMVKKFNR